MSKLKVTRKLPTRPPKFPITRVDLQCSSDENDSIFAHRALDYNRTLGEFVIGTVTCGSGNIYMSKDDMIAFAKALIELANGE